MIGRKEIDSRFQKLNRIIGYYATTKSFNLISTGICVEKMNVYYKVFATFCHQPVFYFIWFFLETQA